MNIWDIFKKNKTETNHDSEILAQNNKMTEFSIPDYFEITSTDIKEFQLFRRTFNIKGDDKELRDKDYEKYQKTKEFYILSTIIKTLDFPAISIINSPDSDFDITLGLKSNPLYRNNLNPSLGLVLMMSNSYESDLATFLIITAPGIMRIPKLVYKKGKCLEFHYTNNIKETKNINKEIAFLSNYKNKYNKSYIDSLAAEKPKDYEIQLIKDLESKIIIQDLNINEQDISILNNFYFELQSNSFDDLSLSLYHSLNERISFISIKNGYLIIKGNDQEEKTIYTTLQEDELSEEMHNLLSKSKIRKK